MLLSCCDVGDTNVCSTLCGSVHVHASSAHSGNCNATRPSSIKTECMANTLRTSAKQPQFFQRYSNTFRIVYTHPTTVTAHTQQDTTPHTLRLGHKTRKSKPPYHTIHTYNLPAHVLVPTLYFQAAPFLHRSTPIHIPLSQQSPNHVPYRSCGVPPFSFATKTSTVLRCKLLV